MTCDEDPEAEAFFAILNGCPEEARADLTGLPAHRLTSLADTARDLMELAEEIRDGAQ